jgi:hypothetical protein
MAYSEAGKGWWPGTIFLMLTTDQHYTCHIKECPEKPQKFPEQWSTCGFIIKVKEFII